MDQRKLMDNANTITDMAKVRRSYMSKHTNMPISRVEKLQTWRD